MCENGCGGCGSPKQGFQPCVCVKNLSKSSQKFIKIKLTSDLGITPAVGVPDYTQQFFDLSRLAVDFCIKLDPCCTSEIAVDNAADLVGFLNATFTANIDPNSSDARNLRAQKFLKGDFTCGQNCC